MTNKTFGIDLEKPIIKNIDDYTTYIVALEVAGKPLPPDMETQLYNLREIAATSNIDPRYKDDKAKQVQVLKPTTAQIIKAFNSTLNHNLRADLKKIKEFGGYTHADLGKYHKLMESISEYKPISLAYARAFVAKIKEKLDEITSNLKIMDDPKFNETIDKVTDRITSDFFK